MFAAAALKAGILQQKALTASRALLVVSQRPGLRPVMRANLANTLYGLLSYVFSACQGVTHHRSRVEIALTALKVCFQELLQFSVMLAQVDGYLLLSASFAWIVQVVCTRCHTISFARIAKRRWVLLRTGCQFAYAVCLVQFLDRLVDCTEIIPHDLVVHA
jgi:hypothetical protein